MKGDATSQGLIARLFLEPGSPLTVQISGRTDQVKTSLVGMEPEEYIIVKVPAVPGLEADLYKGRPIVVRFLTLGRIYGFKCTVIARINRPHPLVFISYPDQIESVDLRKEPRVDCFLPVDMTAKDKQVRGAVTDLSARGCKVAFKGLEADSLGSVESGQEVSLSFDIPGGAKVEAVGGVLRSVTRDGARLQLGIQLEGGEGPGIAAIREYVGSVLTLVEPGL